MLRVGADVVDVDEMVAAVARLGHSYINRVFTPAELGPPSAAGAAATGPVDLAERFAAKEAVVKILAPGGRGFDWRSIEVRRTAAGGWELSLSGTAADLARQAGIGHVSLSVSHAGGLAMAVALGWPGGSRGADIARRAERTEGL